MRKKLQDKMFELSYIFELCISVIVGIAIVIFAVRMVVDTFNVAVNMDGVNSLVSILDDAIILAIGAELIKMLCKHTPETVIEVLAFALIHCNNVFFSQHLQNTTWVRGIIINISLFVVPL